MSTLIRINIGDIVSYDGDLVKVLDVVITPNGVDDPKLVALVYAQKPNGNTVSATADKFYPVATEEYEGFWPTPHHDKLK